MNLVELFLTLLLLMGIGGVVYGVSLYNGVLRLINIIPEISSNISVLIKKRTDLISKLIAIVDSYGLHESSVHKKIASEIGGAYGAHQARGVIERLASLRMAFPELKADGLYNNLMQQLEQVESNIADRREQYNSVVRAYNTVISQFPANILLARFEFKKHAFLSDQELSVRSD